MSSADYYAVTQRQRALERAVRLSKRRVALGRAHGEEMAAERHRLGRLQARLRSHVEANRLVRDYSRERAYGLGAQPRALRRDTSSLAEERFIDAKPKGTAFDVSRRAVNGSAYLRKYTGGGAVGLPVPKKAARQLYVEARRILRETDGTWFERLSAVSWRTGRLVADTFGLRPLRFGAEPTGAQKARMAGEPGGVVLIHNHPGSSLPSPADIISASRPWVRCSVVACHDGTVYALTCDDESVEGAYWSIFAMIKAKNPDKSGEDVGIMAMDELYARNEAAKWFRLRRL